MISKTNKRENICADGKQREKRTWKTYVSKSFFKTKKATLRINYERNESQKKNRNFGI